MVSRQQMAGCVRPAIDCCVGRLFLLSTETGERRLLLQSYRGYDDLEPAFSPDMTRIAFVRHSGPTPESCSF